MSVWTRLLRRRSGVLGADAHLSENDIVSLLRPPSVPDVRDDRARAHLSRCELCADEAAKLEGFLDGLSDTHDSALRNGVSAERSTKQKHRILRRIRRAVEPGARGRLLRFPAVARPTLLDVRLASKWLGAAAAAGLVLGVVLGQWIHVHPDEQAGNGSAEVARVASDVPAPTVSRTNLSNLPLVMTSTSEDGFLEELDQVLSSPPILELTPLDELTPRIRETAVYRW